MVSRRLMSVTIISGTQWPPNRSRKEVLDENFEKPARQSNVCDMVILKPVM
jgi:hypothetical protein